MSATAFPSSLRRSSLTTRAVTVAATLGVAAGVFSGGVAGASPAAPPPEFWMPNGNDSLLLNADAVMARVGVRGLGVSGVSSQFTDSSRRVSPSACVGVYQPAEATAYPQATNVTSVSMDDGTDGAAGHLVQQSVVGFADSATARAQFADATNGWASCAGRELAAKSRTGKTKSWTVGLPAPASADGLRVVTNLGPGGVCERALTVRAAIIVDVMSCASGAAGDPAGQAAAIAAAVRDNVEHRDG